MDNHPTKQNEGLERAPSFVMLLVVAGLSARNWWIAESIEKRDMEPMSLTTKWPDGESEREFKVTRKPNESYAEFMDRVVSETLDMKLRLSKGR